MQHKPQTDVDAFLLYLELKQTVQNYFAMEINALLQSLLVDKANLLTF